jgi:drug/metabolite transporter (DMT)-like permease
MQTPSEILIRYINLLGQRVPGQAYLWLAVAIFGASSAIASKLMEIGSEHLVHGRNPISLCNVLFVGNLCALLVLTALHHQQLRPAVLGRISRREWIGLLLVGILAGGLAPALVFQALEATSVNNVILVGRLELPLTLLLSAWLLQEKVTRWGLIGTVGSLLGIALTLALSLPESKAMVSIGQVQLGWGEGKVALAAIALSISTLVTKLHLQRIPMGLFSIVRTATGTIVYFVVVLILFDISHFSEVFSPFLWQWMLVYGGIVVVLGQALWFQGLRHTPISVSLLVGSFTPIAGVLAAYWILGEAPTQAHYVGGSILLLSIAVGQVGNRRGVQGTPLPAIVTSEIGFKGM